MRWILLLFVFCVIFSFINGEGTEETESSAPKKSIREKFQFPRRRFLRRRLHLTEDDQKGDQNVTTSMSMSVSKSGPSSEPVKSRPLNFSRLNRPKLIFNKNRSGSGTTLQVPRAVPTETNEETKPDTETPSNSFKPKHRPSFGKPPTNRPIVKATLRKLYRPSVKTTATTTTEVEEVNTETDDETHVDPSTTTTTAETTSSEPQTTTTEAPLTTQVPVSSKTSPKNMIIIPVPPSQRKPYHPVIMQVTKSPSVSSTEKPQTRVVTYKLNKMFVPLGIYGKVLPKSEVQQGASQEGTNDNGDAQDLYTAATTNSDKVTGSDSKKMFSATISPAIRHKGTSSEELQTSDDNSRNFAAVTSPAPHPLSEDAIFSDQSWNPFKPQPEKSGKPKKGSKQFFDASQVDLTMNYKPDISSISLTTQKPKIEQISLTTTEMPFYLSGSGAEDGNNRRENYKNQNTMTHMGPPRPFDRPSPPKSMIESIKSAAASAASSIPGLIHGGLSQLSILSNQFEDGSMFGGVPTAASPTQAVSASTSGQSTIQSSASNAASVTIGAPDEETLEYFRKRPHLINGNNFNQPHYSSGFKPVTVPPHFAKAYYASTTTPSPSSTVETTDRVKSTTAKSAYEPTYEFHKPSLLVRSPKNFQEWKDSYVDQLIESSNRYKFSTTPTPSVFESELIRHHWNEINQKYSKNEIDEAKERIYEMFGGPTPPSIEEMLYMRPPSHMSRSSSSAFNDLLKMFRVGFSIGSTTRKPYSRSFGTLRSGSVSDHDGWRPIKAGGEPFVSFNAGISFGAPKPTPLYPGHGGSHFSSSSKPHIPKPFRNSKGAPSAGGSHYDPTEYISQGDDSYNLDGTSSAIRYSSPSKYVRPSPSPSSPLTSEYSHTYYSDDKDFGKGKYEGDDESYKPSSSSLGSLYESDPGLEIIPSSVFYKQKEAGVDVGEIRAVLRPSGMADHVVKSHIPQDVSNIPQISFPEGKLPQQFQTLTQLQDYFQTAEPAPQSHHFQPPLLKLIQNSFDAQKSQVGIHQQAGLALNQPVNHIHQAFGYQQKPTSSPTSAPSHQQHYYSQQPIPSQFSQFGQSLASLAQNNVQYQSNQAPAFRIQQQPQHHHHHHQPQYQSQTVPVKATGDSGLGFTDFELPAGVDPDIAALLKAELDKDDIPAEFRKEFQDQEKSKQQKSQHQKVPTQSSPQRRADSNDRVKAVFHKPIPINPTLITPMKGGRMPPIRNPPPGVPRYVLELARKLRSDKNLQGIVRVTSKKDGGPPIEYLYPVRG